MKKLMMGVAGLAMLAAPLAASAQSYGHWREGGHGGYGRGDYGRGYERGYDRDDGGAIVAGVAGLALGAALAGQGDYGYAPAYDYGPAYDDDGGYAYAPRCFWQNRPYRTYYGGVAYRQIEVCR